MGTKRTCLMMLSLVLGLATGASADLIGHWPLDGNPNDVSGNGHDGVAKGDVTYVAGSVGLAADFNGSDALIDCGDVPLGQTGAITVACWVRPRNIAQNWAGYVSKWTLDNSQRTFWLGQHSTDGWLRFGIYPDGPAAETFVDSGRVVLANDQWTHIACTYDGNIQKIHADGMEVVASSERNAAIVDRGGNLRFGIVSTGNWFDGLVDDVHIYNRALTAGEIEAIMAGQPYPQAIGLTPADGALVEATALVLEWRSGDFAVCHDVYLGTDWEAVADATPQDADLFRGSTTENRLLLQLLDPGTTYYWRVDAVDESNPDSPWKGDVWSFRIRPVIAWDPTPADGIQFVAPDQDLSWASGMGALFHTVYFGRSFDEVDSAATGGWMQADNVYDPGPLEPDTTYYWRVDEFSGIATDKGEVWSFTTVPEITVADPNLLGWWTFEESQGMTAVDWSGHGHHGVVLGGAQWMDGYHGTALGFDGRDDFVDLGNPSDLPSGTSARTICAWAKTNNLAGGWTVVVGYGSPGGSQANGFARNGSLLSGFGYGNDLTVDNFWQIGVWHHLCLTYDGTTATLYADGVQLLSEPKEWSLNLSRARIGRQVNDAAEFWDGMIDDVRIYDKVLTQEDIQQVMRGNPLLAGSPAPSSGAVVDIRDATTLSWTGGDTAVSHDVYFGTDRGAVVMAGKDAAEFRGNQAGTSFSLAGLVEFGGGDYYWRIDEVEADGPVHGGYVWELTVPDYLLVDDFERYSNEVGERPFEVWVDGIGFSQPEPGHPGNGSNAAVGYDIWSPESSHYNGLIMETAIVASGSQSMPVDYNNVIAPFYSEIERTWVTPQDWTIRGVDTLTLHLRGAAANGPDRFYITLRDSTGGSSTVEVADPGLLTSAAWIAVAVPLSDFAGVDATMIKGMIVGLGNPPAAGGAGTLLFDAFRLTIGE